MSTDSPDQHLDTTTGETHAVEFAQVLLQLDKGRVHDELSEQLRTLVAAVTDTLKGGYVTLKFALRPMQDGADVLIATGEVTVKLPKHPPTPSMFFADDDFNLVREDPNQHVLWRTSADEL